MCSERSCVTQERGTFCLSIESHFDKIQVQSSNALFRSHHIHVQHTLHINTPILVSK